MRSWVAAILLATGVTACGGGDGGGPTLPKLPTYPSVAGNYVGTVTQAFPQAGNSFSCPTSTTVNQTQDIVLFTPLALGGVCGGQTVLLPRLVIDTDGKIPTQTTAVPVDCGTYTEVLSGGFFGNEFRLSQIYTSTTCPHVTVTISLFR